MIFTKPAERCLNNMSESSVKKALCIVASHIYSQEGGIQWLNDQLGQFGCTADGLINEVLTDPELTQHPIGQDIHHRYHLHNNPNDEHAAAYQASATSTGSKDKGAHPPQKSFAYAPIHPQVLVEQAKILPSEDYVGIPNSDEQPVEEQAPEVFSQLGTSENSSTAHPSSAKQILATSSNATPFPSPAHTPCSSPAPLNKRGHSSHDDSDNGEDTKPTRPPAKKLKKSNTKPPTSTSSTPTTTTSNSSSHKPTTTSSTRRPSWTPEETEQVYKCLVARREKEASIPGLVKLYDAPLWLHISEALAGVYGIHRTPSGCKANWNRSGRDKYGFDERSALKRSEALATSLQVSKKNVKNVKKKKKKKKKKKRVVVEEEDDYDDDE
ncbi:a4af1334-082d-4202-8b3a-13a2dc62f376-CDS [Sclerotinia trifoliorum]|uniref:A4af1334-082d-4202-8b3a-13a2dc62f376-CDS n=1 Tax=Sclerotinia trifoliorum TaxID=28548 RepID=A0A8H2W6Y3_9HELO|nr:a4af1334-082d-4202-8b3a-13a2dc62f376-CDS [Sclerotinia trifoliorum]